MPEDEPAERPQAVQPAHVILQQWRQVSPVLRGSGVTLRELRTADAHALLSVLSISEVSGFLAPDTPDVSTFQRFIDATHDARAAGRSLAFAVVPDGSPGAIGLFHVSALEPTFGVAEWQCAFGSGCWGDGLFFAAAPVLLDFVFEVLGTRRLEAHVRARNARGNGALRKLGAVEEAVMRSGARGSASDDLVLWAILADEWRARRRASGVQVH
jgi:RimJ/RimL family protein N-acetyltransferase